jgi:LuxR family transcriptional regulator, maltose regulon positive regulatory protein
MQRVPLAKLKPPILPSSVVRSRLDEWHERALQAKLALIQAPAGWGKTTLMLQLLQRFAEEGRGVGWLTVDYADNDVGRFVECLSEVARLMRPLSDDATGPILPQAADEAGVGISAASVLESLTEGPAPFVLFMDDFELIHNHEVLSTVHRLLDQMMPGQLLVLGTRSIPNLGVSRLRVQGQLLEVGAEDLRFGWEETLQFVRRDRSLNLDDAQMARLQKYTEGWAAALQLSTLLLKHSPNKDDVLSSISGNLPHLADYLWEEAVSRQDEDTQRFLLRTSILDRFSASLCDSVTGFKNSGDILLQLERSNLFIARLDEGRQWYRYHRLFAEFLKGRLERDDPELLPTLHASAANWFERRDLYIDATQHRLAAGDMERAADDMEQCVIELMRLGQARTVTHWVPQLPPGVLERHPKVRIALCWAYALLHRHVEAQAVFDEITRSLASLDTVDEEILDHMRAIEPVLVALTDRFDESMHLAERNRSSLVSGSFSWDILSILLGTRLMESGRFQEARGVLDAAWRNQRETGNRLSATHSACLLGTLELTQGRLRKATELFRWAATWGLHDPESGQAGAAAAIYLASALYEMDELDEAEVLLMRFRDIFCDLLPADLTLLGYATLARIHTIRGEVTQASALLDEAEAAGKQRNMPRIPATVHLFRIRLALSRGDLQEAQELHSRFDDHAAWQALEGWDMQSLGPETPESNELRLLVRQGEVNKAIPRLRSALARAETSHRLWRALNLRVILAEALDKAGDGKAALRLMREALLFGAEEGFIRIFLDDKPYIGDLVARAAAPAVAAPGQEGTIAAFHAAKLSGKGAHAHKAGGEEAAELGLVEPLTAREQQILAMVAAGLPNSALADRLFLSPHTVKFHLRNINAKLLAHNRTEAVAKARRLGLLT